MYWDGIKDFALVLCGSLLFAGVIIALTIGIGQAVTMYKCNTYQEITGKETQFRFIAGCYVQTAAGWEHWEEYKLRAAASEGLKALAK